MSGIQTLRLWFLKRPAAIAALFALGAALMRYFPFLLGKTIFFGDNFSLQVPGKIWTAYWLKQGVIPLWNPLLFSGLNWVGDISQTPLSPAVLPFVLLPPALALNFDVLFYFIFTFMGMYLLAKETCKNLWWSIAAGGLWASSSLWLSGANNLVTLQSLSWFPWIIWGGLTLEWKRWPILRLALLIVGQVTAGYPQHLLIALPAAAWLSLARPSADWKKWLGSWLACAAVAFGLSAPITLPFLPVLLGSTRQLLSAQQAAHGSLFPAELVKILLPYFFDAPLFGIRWGPNWNFFPTSLPYFTWIGLVIFLTAQWKKILADRLNLFIALGALAGVVISLGSNIPGYLTLLSAIPGLSTIRYPSSWLVVTEIFGLLLLAAAAGKWQPAPWLRRWAPKLLLASLMFSLTAFFLWQKYPQELWGALDQLLRGKLRASPFHTPERDRLISLLILGNVAANSLLALLSWQAWQRKLWPALTALLILEGIVNSQAMALFAPASIYASTEQMQSLPLAKALADPQYRVLTRNLNSPYADYVAFWEAVVVRQPFSDSFVDAAGLKSAAHLVGLRDGLTPDWNLAANVPVVNGYTTLLPSDYQTIWESNTETRVNLLSKIELDNPNLAAWSTKYYLVDRWFKIEEKINFPQVYADDRWAVYQLPALSRFRFGDGSAAQLTSFQEKPNLISFGVAAATHSSLIVADRFETGWKAKLNGRVTAVEIEKGMRKIRLEPGDNAIELSYYPSELTLGLMIFGLTAGLILLSLKGRRNSP